MASKQAIAFVPFVIRDPIRNQHPQASVVQKIHKNVRRLSCRGDACMSAAGEDSLLSLLHKSTHHHTWQWQWQWQWQWHHTKQIHATLITRGLAHRSFFLAKLLSSLLASHSQPLPLSYASLLFDRIHNPTVRLWDLMLRAFSASSRPQMCVAFYSRMRTDGIIPTQHTFPLLLKSLSRLKTRNPIQFIPHVIKFGWEFDGFVRNSLIAVLGTCGYVELARQVFDDSPSRDAVAWTCMMDGYVANGRAVDGLRCFNEMRLEDVRVDEVSVVGVLCAAGMSGDVWFGRSVHGLYVATGRVKWDVYVGTALLDVYSKCGQSDDAQRLFDEMPRRNVVSWTTLIAGYVRCNRLKDGVACFQEMIVGGCKPNQTTLATVLGACAQLGALDHGRWVHQYLNMSKLEISPALGATLIDMYSKCGCLNDAFSVFEKLPMKDVYSWSAMINGFAAHGDAGSALNLFLRMLSCGIEPNEVTFIGVLSACAHGGFVAEGRKFFMWMRHSFCLEPNADHYGCMVDMLSRSGYLTEARELIESMPMEATAAIWGALFSACIYHKAYDLGEHVGKLLIKMQPDHSGRYALLANLYAGCHNWEAAAQVRRLMQVNGIKKTRGCSWIEIDGIVNEFVAFDASPSQLLYKVLSSLGLQTRPTSHDTTKILPEIF